MLIVSLHQKKKHMGRAHAPLLFSTGDRERKTTNQVLTKHTLTHQHKSFMATPTPNLPLLNQAKWSEINEETKHLWLLLFPSTGQNLQAGFAAGGAHVVIPPAGSHTSPESASASALRVSAAVSQHDRGLNFTRHPPPLPHSPPYLLTTASNPYTGRNPPHQRTGPSSRLSPTHSRVWN